MRALSDSSGSVVQVQATDAWGMVTQAQGSVSQPFGYTGEVQDPNGLVNLRARMYDPSSGRFLQQDPLPGQTQRPTSLNRDAYALNNPCVFSDHAGLAVCTLGGSISASGFGATLGASVVFGVDQDGQAGVAITAPIFGGSTGFGVSASAVGGAFWGLPDVNSLAGPFGEAGGSVGPVGGEAVFDPSRSNSFVGVEGGPGANLMLSELGKLPPLPFELHGTGSFTLPVQDIPAWLLAAGGMPGALEQPLRECASLMDLVHPSAAGASHKSSILR